MDSKVAAFAATPDPTFGQKATPQPRPDTGAAAASVAQGPDQVDVRLVIEEDKATNSYVYKTVNRLTGEVIQQLPREQVLQLREQLDYEAGNVVRTKA
ncbi:MAG: flagellar protein FlaG [Phenylobacterium sp.]